MTPPKALLNFDRCTWDFPYYAANLLNIKDKESRLIRFTLNEPQIKLQRCMDDLKAQGKLQRIIVLKARQEGISTYAEGRIFHSAHMAENTKNIIIAHEKESGSSIFGMCRLFYDCLPKSLRPMTRYSSKKEIVFENPDKKTRYKNPGLRSSLEVYTAGKVSVGRGTTVHNMHASELASWQFPQEVIPALLPTIPKNLDNFIIYESTAKGVANFFHDEWQRSVDGESNFTPFFLAWFDLFEYSHRFHDIEQRKALVESYNEEEQELVRQFDLTPEQMYWRRLTIADLHGDVELFRQEYPSTPEEAFIVSGVCVFDRRKLRSMSIKCSGPKFRGDVEKNGRLLPNEQGQFRMWKGPQTDAEYCIGVDVADGGEQGDFSCVEVWKKLAHPFVAEQVAEWHGHLDPYNLSAVVEKLARMYNSALVGVEINAHGLATQQELQKTYWNLYQQEYFDHYTAKFTQKVGWLTNQSSKKLLISFMSHCIADMVIIIHSSDLIKECMTFIRNEEGTGEAAGKGHDDRVMAGMIGLFVMHRQMDTGGERLDVTRTPKTVAPSISHDVNYIDKDFNQILEFGRQDTYDESWLNY